MRRLDKLLFEYSQSHKNKVNIIIHAIAVPAIFMASIGIVFALPLPPLLSVDNVTWANIVLLPVLAYYFWLSFVMGVAMTVLSGISLGIMQMLANINVSVLKISIIVFLLMWGLQFWGHKIERKKPSFLKDCQFLLIGPAWWWCHWFTRLGIRY